ncbi:MAG: hypothetical protein RQM92_17955 [Candidatus Syntrophopropionicum ammoniitolerans]
MAGVQIAGMIMENLGLLDMLVSECDILYGLALEEIEKKVIIQLPELTKITTHLYYNDIVEII